MLNPKSQIPNPKQIPNSKFKILFVIYCFVFGIYTNVYGLNLDKVKIHFLAGDYKAAIAEGEKILAKSDYSSHSDELYYILGLSYLKDDNFLRASDIFEIILKEFKRSTFKDEALLGLGDVYFLKGDYERAQGYYKKLINSVPKTKLQAAAYYRLSQIKFKKGDTQQAKVYLDRLKQRFPLSPEAKLSSVELSSSSDLYYSVQVGSFSIPTNAKNLKQKLIQKGYPAYIEEASSKGKIIYRVRAGKFSNRQEAIELEDKLILEGYPTKVCP